MKDLGNTITNSFFIASLTKFKCFPAIVVLLHANY